MFLTKPKILHWTFHARSKMRFYKLSEGRVLRVLNSPKRIEEGVAPKTVAMMQPVSTRFAKSDNLSSKKREETWNQEIWVMVEDKKGQRKIVSAWRYPGRTKPRDNAAIESIKRAYSDYLKQKE